MDVPFFPQDAVLALELVQFGLLLRRQVPRSPFPRAGLGLPDPVAQRLTRDAQIVGATSSTVLPVFWTKSTARVRNSLGYGGFVCGMWTFPPPVEHSNLGCPHNRDRLTAQRYGMIRLP